MTDVASEKVAPTLGFQAQRLHHFAFDTLDMAKTRHFYEQVIGMPLAQTWVEARQREDGSIDEYLHCFYSLADGGAIAYFQHADAKPIEYPKPQVNFHIAFKVDHEVQEGIIKRLKDAEYPDSAIRVTDHGYCVSLYVTDPNGLRLEFTVDHPQIDEIVATQAVTAGPELERWLAGDHTVNNNWRPKEPHGN